MTFLAQPQRITADAPSPAVSVAELDVFRGFAAVAMIVNHAGYELLSSEHASSGLTGLVVFLGSFAPALFFFATGFGVGISKVDSANPSELPAVLYKAGLLMLADQFLWWRTGVSWGLDFFGFIGLSLLLVSLLTWLPNPLRAAGVIAIGLILMRFVVAPLVKGHVPATTLLIWLLGSQAQEAVSYPAAPWLFYPLSGLIAGVLYRRCGGQVRERDGRSSLIAPAIVVLSLACAAILVARNASFHRWGAVGVGYFTLSIAVVVSALMLAWFVGRNGLLRGFLRDLLMLRGVASYMVVPVHYLLLRLTGHVGFTPMAPSSFAISVVALVLASLIFSRAFEAALKNGLRSLGPASWPVLVLVTTFSAGACLMAISEVNAFGFYASITGQLAIGAMLVLRPKWAQRGIDSLCDGKTGEIHR